MSRFVECWTLSPVNYGGYYSKDKCPERRGPLVLVSERSREKLEGLRREYQKTSGNQHLDLCRIISKKRRKAYKELYHARMNEIVSRAQQRDRRRIAFTLQGRSTGKPMNTLVHDGQHTLKPRRDSDWPRGVKRGNVWLPHWPIKRRTANPRMTTPIVVEVRERFGLDPFEWPQEATLTDFQAMLRHSNQRPVPGPDGWEKWCVKNLSKTVAFLKKT